ncbi:MAG: ferric reductase-like transmembrane domain-containing protein [Filomicrobium sp.]
MGRTFLIWTALFCAIVVPIAASAMSPLLAWREPIYIAAGFAGVFGLALMLVQPMLVGGYLPGISRYRARRVHRWIGAALVSAVIVHVVGLWITSPPDVVDALLFRSPTPFSVWGVIAMWAIFAVALLALFRRHLRLRIWRISHTLLAVVIVSGTVIHSLLIEGTMEILSKVALCGLVLVATAKAMLDLRVWAKRRTSREGASAD